MNQLPRYVYYLLAAQAFNLIAAVLSVTVAAIVGLKLAPTQALATVPYGLQFLAMLLTTFIFSFLMKKLGRHLVFQFGCVCLFLAGVLGYLALQQQQFYLLCLSHFSLGLFISTANFYRFAASDRLATDLIPKATAMVITQSLAHRNRQFLSLDKVKHQAQPKATSGGLPNRRFILDFREKHLTDFLYIVDAKIRVIRDIEKWIPTV